MKLSIIIDFILPIIAVIHLCGAMYLHVSSKDKLELNKLELERRGLLYLIAEDKKVFRIAVLTILFLLTISNVLLATWSFSRIDADFIAYATTWIAATAVVFHFIMLVIARMVYLLYKGSKFTFLAFILKKLQSWKKS